MKLLLLVSFLLINTLVQSMVTKENVKEQYYIKITEEGIVWTQRYWMKIYNDTGPTFLYLGGEAGSEDQISGTVLAGYDFIQLFGGTLIELEHRGYGSSLVCRYRQTECLLKYQNTQAALQDIFEFIEWKNLTNVITIGGSYAGSLSILARALRPDLIAGAIGSSGYPTTLAPDGLWKQLELLSSTFDNECFNSIKSLPKTNITGICNDNTELLPYVLFVYFLQNKNACNQLKTNKNIGKDMIKHFNVQCFSTDPTAYIETFKQDTNYRSWIFQLCHEYNYFTTSNKGNHPFPRNLNISSWRYMCSQSFEGVQLNNGSQILNKELLLQTTNIFVTYSLEDISFAIPPLLELNLFNDTTKNRITYNTEEGHTSDYVSFQRGNYNLANIRISQAHAISSWTRIPPNQNIEEYYKIVVSKGTSNNKSNIISLIIIVLIITFIL